MSKKCLFSQNLAKYVAGAIIDRPQKTRMRIAGGTRPSPTPALSFLHVILNAAKNPRTIDNPEILRRYAPQNDNDGGTDSHVTRFARFSE